MKLEKMAKDQEKKLVQGVEFMIGQIKSAALDPTTALIKAANEYDLNLEEVRRVAEAYNISKSLANQREKQGDARCEPFELAHADLAVKQMFPADYKTHGQVKAASRYVARAKADAVVAPVNYISKVAAFESTPRGSFEAMTKIAGTKPATERPDQKAARLYKEASKKKLEVDLVKQAHDRSKFDMMSKLSKAAEAIRQSDVPFERIEQATVQQYGESAKKLNDLLYMTSKQASFKAARATKFNPVIVDRTQEPFASIESFVDASLKFQSATEKYASARKADCDWVGGFLEKSALEMPWTSKMMGRLSGGLNANEDPLYNQTFAKAVGKMNDPKYTNELRRIQIQSMLVNWMSNDEVIKGYAQTPEGVEQIMNAYNELASIHPAAAENPALAKSFIRRTLQVGQIDPMEINQLAQTGEALDNAGKPIDPTATVSAAILGNDPKAIRPDLFRMRANTNKKTLANIFSGKPQSGWNVKDDPSLQSQLDKEDREKKQFEYSKQKDKASRSAESAELSYRKQRDTESDKRQKLLDERSSQSAVYDTLASHQKATGLYPPKPGQSQAEALKGGYETAQKDLSSILGSDDE